MRNNRWQILLLIVILLGGLVLRLAVAPNKGSKSDILLFQVWSYSAVENGIGHIYNTPIGQTTTGQEIPTPNYLPLYLYFLKFSGTIYNLFFSPEFKIGLTTPLTFILKLNGIFFDVLTALAIFLLLKKFTHYRIALLSMLVYYLNPGVIYNSSYWGQVDSIHAFFIILSLFFLTQKRFPWSWVFITLAMLMKLQSFVILPIIILVTIKEKGWKKLLNYVALSLGVFLIITLPFIATGNFQHVLRVIFTSAGYSPYISMNAFNIWWPFTHENMFAVRDLVAVAGVPYFAIGLALFIATLAFITRFLNKGTDYQTIFFAASFTSFAFFMLPTEMHERYMYPVLPIVAMLLFLDKRFWLIYGALSLTFFVNLVAVQPFGRSEVLIGTDFDKSLWVVAVNIAVLIYFFYLSIKFLRQNRKGRPNEKNLVGPANI